MKKFELGALCVLLVALGMLIMHILTGTIVSTKNVLIQHYQNKAEFYAEQSLKLYKQQVADYRHRVKIIETNEKELIGRLAGYIMHKNKAIPQKEAFDIAECIVHFSNETHLPFYIIAAVAEVESHFDITAVGSHGERGIMQVMWKYWGDELDWIDNERQLHGIYDGMAAGVHVLQKYYKKFGSIKKALYNYNGKSNAYVRKVLSVSNDIDLWYRVDKGRIQPLSRIDQSLRAKVQPPIRMRTHVVEKGDTLYKLAKLYLEDGNRWHEIAELNGIKDPAHLTIGMKLFLPGPSGSG